MTTWRDFELEVDFSKSTFHLNISKDEADMPFRTSVPNHYTVV